MLTNTEVLEMLTDVQEQHGDWHATLDELVDTFEKAVADEAADITDASPFTVVGSGVYDADTDRWESAGMAVDRNGVRQRDYRDTL